MPSLGSDMEAGTLVEWLKRPGDTVRHGDIIAVVETEKGAIEIEVFENGTIDQLIIAPGTKVPVGTVLARISGSQPGLSGSAKPTAQIPPSATSAPQAPPQGTPRQYVNLNRRVSPAARKLALEQGIDPGQVHGTGPGGAVIRSDIEQSLAVKDNRPARDLDPMRRAIAAAMARSKREIPHYYLAHNFDMSPSVAWLDTYNKAMPPSERLLLAAVTLKATALALREFPEFNGFYTADGYQPSNAIHLGIAISIRGGGLAAPAIHHCDQLSLADLMARMRDLVGRVRKGEFRSSEISDPTMTVSSLGERGVDALLPIIYPPQVAIVGFGSTKLRPWVIDGRVEARSVMTATLAADHRVSDGHRGAIFLDSIARRLTEPDTLS
ncbi:MAG: dihydrolipoamide acetyltransferase family protein [Sphingorhabdus sp.]